MSPGFIQNRIAKILHLVGRDAADDRSATRIGEAPARDVRIIAIGGGKGGVGKSLIAGNLAVSMALSGRSVLAVDLDLGGANLHTCLGISETPRTLADYLVSESVALGDVILPTPITNLCLISGSGDPMGTETLTDDQRGRLRRDLRSAGRETVVLDLSPGTSADVLDLFLSADEGILVVTPEPTSIENVYRFIRGLLFRAWLNQLKTAGRTDCESVVRRAMMDRKYFEMSPQDFLDYLDTIDPEGCRELRSVHGGFRLSLVLNKLRTEKDRRLGKSIQIICADRLNLNVAVAAEVPYDNTVWQAIRERRPLVLEYPNSASSSAIRGIIERVEKRR